MCTETFQYTQKQEAFDSTRTESAEMFSRGACRKQQPQTLQPLKSIHSFFNDCESIFFYFWMTDLQNVQDTLITMKTFVDAFIFEKFKNIKKGTILGRDYKIYGAVK